MINEFKNLFLPKFINKLTKKYVACICSLFSSTSFHTLCEIPTLKHLKLTITKVPLLLKFLNIYDKLIFFIFFYLNPQHFYHIHIFIQDKLRI